VKIKMKTQLTGTRNGVAWPAPGGEVELSDLEGAKLCKAGLAEPVAEDKVEKATPAPAEKRGPGRPRRGDG